MIIIRNIEQREYSAIGRKLGNWLDKKISDADIESGEIGYKLSKDLGVNNRKLLKESIREGRDKYNARTVSPWTAFGFSTKGNIIPNGSSNIDTESIKKNNFKTFRKSSKMKNIVENNDNIIVHETEVITDKGKKKSARAESHAHEVGHLRNDSKGGLLIRRSRKSREKFETPSSKDSGSGLIEGLSRTIDTAAILHDEKKASKNALRFMKEKGATKEELEKAKENLDLGLKTYKKSGTSYILRPIRKMIKDEKDNNI